jgi:hypothetical protein
LLTTAQNNAFVKKMCSPYVTSTNIILNGTSTGNEPAVYDRESEVKQIVKKHSKGYYYLISVSDTDEVFFMVYHASDLAYWVHKIIGAHLPSAKQVTEGWGNVRKRTHLPATLGAAYQAIDEAVEAHKETYKEVMEHDEYIGGLLETEPENLKMIEGLEKLQEGDPETEAEEFVGYNTTVSFSGISLASSKQSSCFYTPLPP